VARYDEYESVKVEFDKGVLTVSLNRPDHGNAIDGVMHTEFTNLFHDIRNDYDTRAVVLTGEGTEYFCNGPDIAWYLTFDEAISARVIREAKFIIQDLLNVPQPIVVALNGAAMGFGSSLAVFGDIIVAADNAVLGDKHVMMGVTAGDGGAWILPHVMGINRTKEYLFLGEELTADTLLELGVVSKVVPNSEVKVEATAIARKLADMPPSSLQWTKSAINRQLQFNGFLSADGAMGHAGWNWHQDDTRAIADQLRTHDLY
jgi:enoyl-CoA hydratase